MGEKSTFFFKTWQLLYFGKVTSHLSIPLQSSPCPNKTMQGLKRKSKILIFYEWWNYCRFLIKYDFRMCKKYVNGLFCQQGLFFEVCLHFLISKMQTPQHLFLSSLFLPSPLISQLFISSLYNLNLDNTCFIFWCCQYHPTGFYCMVF